MILGVGGLIFGGWQANLRWEEFKPVLAELEEKHPEKYAQMVEEAKSFHLKDTQRLFYEIKNMKREEVINLRYEKWSEKRKADNKFYEDYYDAELLNRIEVHKALLTDYQSRSKEVQSLHVPQPVKLRFEQWIKTEPWKQRLVLQEKCVKYVKMEIKDREVFQKDLEVSKISTLMAQISNKPLSVDMLCNHIVPETNSPLKIQEAILRLKQTLTFDYYIQLLEEVGIPRRNIVSFKDELVGRVRGYSGF
jgi:hypothetical protein